MRVYTVFASALFFTSSLLGEDDAYEKQRILTFCGRPQIEIFASADEVFGASGLTSAKLKDTTELILRRNGVPVVAACGGYEYSVENGKVLQKRANCGRLIVNAQGVTALGAPVCAYYVRAEYREWVSPVRPEAKYIKFGALWEEDQLGTVGMHRLEQVKDAVRDVVEKFALHYLKADSSQPTHATNLQGVLGPI